MPNKTRIFSAILYVIFMFVALSVNAETKSDTENASPKITSYVIGPGDLLKISVWKEEGMEQQVLVKPDGGITFPLAGDINASGMTTIELTQELVKKLKRYIPNPNVTVSVLQAVSNKVFVIGKVNRPGEFNATGYMDVLQALTMAGGLTPYADSDDIKIIRRTKEGNKVMDFDYDDVASGESLDMNIILQAGDTVVVP